MKPLFILMLAGALVAPFHASVAADPPARVVPRDTAAELAALRTRVTRLADADALRELAYAYGRGNDALAARWADREAGKKAGAAEYARAFAANVRVEVRALGASEPLGRIDGIPAWVDFVDQFYGGKGYAHTLHLMSNFRITFTGDSTARVSAYALAPHFLTQAAARAADRQAVVAEWMLCRYQYDAVRQADGSWRIVRMDIQLDEIMRHEGFFPDGQADGRRPGIASR